MAIIQGNAKQGSTRGFYPKVINGSLRFNDDDSAYLSWTPASAGNRKTWTWSAWVKRGNLGATLGLFSSDGTDDATKFELFFSSGDQLGAQGNSTSFFRTTQVFRDPSAWYHIVLVWDAVNTTINVYVNGVQVSDWAISPTISNTDYGISRNAEHYLGSRDGGGSNYDGYLANVHFIDGQALTASDFGETKNGVWVAKDYAGTFGTNGFYLTFEDDTAVEAFNTVLWRGNGSSTGQSITGVGFQPDLIWIKKRSGANSHNLIDSVRGADKRLYSDLTNAEASNTGFTIDSDGFTTTSAGSQNEAGFTFVGWCWKAGDSNVSNTDGTITSTVRANDTYGFSIVSYTGDANASKTIGHGLSTAPDMIIVKGRNVAQNWVVYHSANTGSPETQRLYLDGTNATDTVAWWNNTAPTSSVFSVSNFGGTGGAYNYIAYCWAEKTGYSKFGSYTGNGSTSGPTVTCGFKPAMIILKRTDSGGSWTISDNTRDTVNPVTPYLFPHASDAEATDSSNEIDFNSNGFQIKHSTRNNTSGATYIYAAFADTREAAFWLDQSGNDNDWQPVNLDHNDTVADSPTNNFATLNPLFNPNGSNVTYSDGNLTYTTATANPYNAQVQASIGVNSGKYFYEYTANATTVRDFLGWAYQVQSIGSYPTYIAIQSDSSGVSGGTVTSGTAPTYTTGDVIGFGIDLDANTFVVHKNGSFACSGTITTTGENYFPWRATSDSGFAGGGTFNFGQQPFKYDPPA